MFEFDDFMVQALKNTVHNKRSVAWPIDPSDRIISIYAEPVPMPNVGRQFVCVYQGSQFRWSHYLRGTLADKSAPGVGVGTILVLECGETIVVEKIKCARVTELKDMQIVNMGFLVSHEGMDRLYGKGRWGAHEERKAYRRLLKKWWAGRYSDYPYSLAPWAALYIFSRKRV